MDQTAANQSTRQFRKNSTKIAAQWRHGFSGLRFTKTLERQFQAESAPARNQHLLVCSLIGLVAGPWGAAPTEALMLPDLVGQLWPQRLAFTALALFLLVVIRLTPSAFRSPWLPELAISLVIMLMCSGIIIPSTSRSVTLTAAVHSADLIAATMFVGTLVRLRFWYSLGVSLVNLLAFATLIPHRSIEHGLILSSNFKVLLVAGLLVQVSSYLFEYRDRQRWLLAKQNDAHASELKEANRRLRDMSLRDGLTGLLNRRGFEEALSAAQQDTATQSSVLSLLVLDVDHFKRFNDFYGHPQGDRCLQQVSAILEAVARDHGGQAARIGGEEFAVVLPSSSTQQAQALASAIKTALGAAAIEHQASEVARHVTVSIGMAQGPVSITGARLVAAADAALYEAKRSGRNRAVVGEVLGEASGLKMEVRQASGSQSPGHAPYTVEDDAAALSAILANGVRWLRFPAHVEKHYQSIRSGHHQWRLPACILLSVLGFNVFAFLYEQGAPNATAWMQKNLTALNIAGLVLSLLLMARGWGRWKEALVAGAFSALALMGAYALSLDHSLVAYPTFMVLILIPMASCILAQQSPFHVFPSWAAVVIGYLGFTSAASGSIEVIVRNDIARILIVGGMFILLASYTLARAERRSYLLNGIQRGQRAALVERQKDLESLVSLDPLTGLHNRRHFDQALQALWNTAERGGTAVSLLILDIDFFKRYNDSLGHQAGDAALQKVAMALRQMAAGSEGCLAARLGGEEFALLVGGGEEAALKLGEAVCTQVRQCAIDHPDSDAAGILTVSVGVATMMPSTLLKPYDLMSMADRSLYQAKAAGRNGMAVAGRAP